jgi:hypothetical protein
LVACSDNGSGVIRGRSKATLLHAVKARKSGTQIKGLAAVRSSYSYCCLRCDGVGASFHS